MSLTLRYTARVPPVMRRNFDRMTAVLVEDGPDVGAIWHLGEPNKEQRMLYEGLAWADLSHFEIIAITGEDRLSWLHSLTTQYLENLQADMWTPVLILDPQGHIEHQFNLVDDGSTTWLTLDPGRAQALIEHLAKMKFM
jgi:folate-binding Fe-S cluster repair protein YgfZ